MLFWVNSLITGCCRPQLVLTVLDGLDVQIPRNVSRFLSEQRHAQFLECRYHDARNFLQVRYKAVSDFVVEWAVTQTCKIVHFLPEQKKLFSLPVHTYVALP